MASRKITDSQHRNHSKTPFGIVTPKNKSRLSPRVPERLPTAIILYFRGSVNSFIQLTVNRLPVNCFAPTAQNKKRPRYPSENAPIFSSFLCFVQSAFASGKLLPLVLGLAALLLPHSLPLHRWPLNSLSSLRSTPLIRAEPHLSPLPVFPLLPFPLSLPPPQRVLRYRVIYHPPFPHHQVVCRIPYALRAAS